MANPSISIEDGLLGQIDDDLEYGDSRSEWVRDAIKLKISVLELLAECEPVDEWEDAINTEEGREYVIEALREKIEREYNC